jgi:Tfp pilus assembly protein PilV
MSTTKKKKTGQSLIEVLLGLTIAGLILGGITIAVISSLRNAQFAKNQNLASQFASQGLEIVREIRDREDSFNLEDKAGTYCLGGDGELVGTTTCDLNVGTPLPSYSRKVEIEAGGPTNSCKSDAYYVVVSVSWWDNACQDTNVFCHKVDLASCLVKRSITSL